MTDVGLGDLAAGGLIVLIGWSGTLFCARKLHKIITGKAGKEDKPRWFAANAAGIVFILFGFGFSPRIVGGFSRYLSGVEIDLTETIALIVGMLFFSAIGAAFGFAVGKLRMPRRID